MKIVANGIAIEVETSPPLRRDDATRRPVVLLIMGLGMQLTAWPQALVDALVEAGYEVVRFDNRDAGLSQHFGSGPRPRLLWEGFKYQLRLPVKALYSLQDMAADAVGVLDALGVAHAHVLGASMGGMIAQRLALMAPERVCSLTSVMSSSGARSLPGPHPAVRRAILSRPRNLSREGAIEHTVKFLKLIGSPGLPMDDTEVRQGVQQAIERSYDPDGVARQLLATAADCARAGALSRIAVPTLVVHGKADLLLPLACGVDTAARIPGARLVAIEGMGHDLSPGVVAHLLPLMLEHFKRAATGAKAKACLALPSVTDHAL